jgi:hypothetical protein
MIQMCRTLRVAGGEEGVLSAVIDAPPMNLIGPDLVRDLVTLLSDLDADANIRVMVLESADPEYFVPQRRPDQGRGVHRRQAAWSALMRTALGLCYRSGLNAARISVANHSGSSQAAKWPPLLASWK